MALKKFLSFDRSDRGFQSRKNFALPVSSRSFLDVLQKWFLQLICHGNSIFLTIYVEFTNNNKKGEKKNHMVEGIYLYTKIIDNSRLLAPSTIGREKFSGKR